MWMPSLERWRRWSWEGRGIELVRADNESRRGPLPSSFATFTMTKLEARMGERVVSETGGGVLTHRWDHLVFTGTF